jgi:hypothetical protein
MHRFYIKILLLLVDGYQNPLKNGEARLTKSSSYAGEIKMPYKFIARKFRIHVGESRRSPELAREAP